LLCLSGRDRLVILDVCDRQERSRSPAKEISCNHAPGWFITSTTEDFSNEPEDCIGGDNVPITQQITRKWVMSADGKTFTVDLFGKAPSGDVHTKRIFVKK
jgi:hypothetical protein